TSAAPPWAFATSPTTSPDPCSKPADSHLNYTVNHQEPDIDALCETLKSLRRSNADQYWAQWRAQQGLS
ncbi:hypothetical protein ACK280_27325, partial [Mycobacterium sherrisii]|uniref:hypothetical protein n=1 Tax=Mycobacterium sherrisii TaxID=243061 RepID=UPI003974D8BF